MRSAADGAIELAQAALAARRRTPTYARVDIVRRRPTARLRIMELELIEPALFLDHAPDGGAAFAAARSSAARASNSHWRIAEVRFGGRSRIEPRGVDLRNQRIDGQPRSRAAASSARQNIGSRLIEV